MMRIEDINAPDMAKIASKVFALAKLTGDPYASYIRILADHGIVCPHPQKKRLYGGRVRSERPSAKHKWYDCEMCGCSVFNEVWLRSIREEEKKTDESGDQTFERRT